MPTATAAQRLSPKVRRLLREHGLHGRAVPGTGAAGRVTPRDVLAAAGVPPRPADGRALASPLARRTLRAAGIDPSSAARANDGRRITHADAERLIGELSGAPAPSEPPATPSTGDAAVTEVQVDVALLLSSLAAVDDGFLAWNGFQLTVEVAVASAVAALLVRRPELAGDAAAPPEGAGTAPSIHLGFVPPDVQEPTVAIVPDAQHLTVAGLARRARAALSAAAGEDSPGPTAPTVVVARGAAGLDASIGSGGLGLLTVGAPMLLQVEGVDELGHEIVRTRPHVALRLHHDGRTTGATATAFLTELGAAVTSWSLPVGP